MLILTHMKSVEEYEEMRISAKKMYAVYSRKIAELERKRNLPHKKYLNPNQQQQLEKYVRLQTQSKEKFEKAVQLKKEAESKGIHKELPKKEKFLPDEDDMERMVVLKNGVGFFMRMDDFARDFDIPLDKINTIRSEMKENPFYQYTDDITFRYINSTSDYIFYKLMAKAKEIKTFRTDR